MSSETPVKSHVKANLALIEGFERWLLVQNYSKAVQMEYPRIVRRFCDFLGAEDVTATDSRTIRFFLAQDSATPDAFQGKRVAVRAFYRFLVLCGVIPSSPASLIRRPKLRRRLPRCLSEKDVERLVTSPNSARDLALLELLYASGLRASEASHLQIEDLNLDQGTLMVRRGKGNKDRLAMVGSFAVTALRAHLRRRKTGFVFLNHRGSRLGMQGILTIVKESAKLAGLEGVHTHTFRHTFATVLRNHGADIRHIQELMGHVRVSTTAIYLQTAIEDLAQVLDRCHPHSKGGNDDTKG